MTALELIDQVLSKLGEAQIAGPEIEGVLPQALRALARQVAYSPNRELLRKDFSVSVASGTGDLTTALTASEPLLLECIDHAAIYGTSDTTPWQYLPDRVQLGLKRPSMFVYFTVDKSTLRTRNTDGSLTSLTTTATVTSNYVPSLANVPSSIEDDLVDVVIRILAPTVEAVAPAAV